MTDPEPAEGFELFGEHGYPCPKVRVMVIGSRRKRFDARGGVFHPFSAQSLLFDHAFSHRNPGLQLCVVITCDGNGGKVRTCRRCSDLNTIQVYKPMWVCLAGRLEDGNTTAASISYLTMI
jgi:hypothetical protein